MYIWISIPIRVSEEIHGTDSRLWCLLLRQLNTTDTHDIALCAFRFLFFFVYVELQRTTKPFSLISSSVVQCALSDSCFRSVARIAQLVWTGWCLLSRRLWMANECGWRGCSSLVQSMLANCVWFVLLWKKTVQFDSMVCGIWSVDVLAFDLA